MKKTLTNYLEEISEKTSVSGLYAFRGQGKGDWLLCSGATRRLLSHYQVKAESEVPNFQTRYIDYHRHVLIEPARTNGWGLEEGRRLSDLELLAKLQHFGAATGLLDFTRNRLVALWFACHNDRDDGKLFAINTNNPLSFKNITYDQTEQKISDILSADLAEPLWYWEPIAFGEAKTRILCQHSLFVIGSRPLIPKSIVQEITIAREDKSSLLEELEKAYDINEESLFRDLYGFASVNQSSCLIHHFDYPVDYFQLGNREYQRGHHCEAIAHYDKVIGLDPDYLEAYFNRGNAKAALGRYHDAARDYTKVIEGAGSKVTEPHNRKILWQAYFNRGNAEASLGHYPEAIANYDQVLSDAGKSKLLKTTRGHVFFNRGNAYFFLKKYFEAIDNYNCSLDCESMPAYWFNRGNAEVKLNHLEKARESYRCALKINSEFDPADKNRSVVRMVLNGKRGSFVGNAGNIGMVGGNYGLPGGVGARSGPNFMHG